MSLISCCEGLFGHSFTVNHHGILCFRYEDVFILLWFMYIVMHCMLICYTDIDDFSLDFTFFNVVFIY